MRKPYPDDLNDDEWDQIEPILTQNVYRGAGTRPKYPCREILNAIFYILRTGCRWRDLPNDFPPWKTVYAQFLRWKRKGVFAELHHTVRKSLRKALGKCEMATAGIVDNQSVRTTGKKGVCGYDGGKKIKGRKRHILVDHLGYIIDITISAANIGDREGFEWLLTGASKQKKLPRIVWADQGYSGSAVIQKAESLGVKVEIVSRMLGLCKDTWKLKPLEGFHIVPKRWIVERTFAWFGKFRRLSKDCELSVSTSTVMIYLAMTRLMLRRMTCSA